MALESGLAAAEGCVLCAEAFNVKDPSSRLLRWRLKLKEYEYEVVYKSVPATLTPTRLVGHFAENCPDDQEIKLQPTTEEKQIIFQEMHNKPVGGHLGMNTTYDRMKLFTSWPGMK